MADTIRGDGLFIADRALAALVENPQRLDGERERFSESPPSYRSHMSHNSTRSQSPNPPSEEQRRREERKWQLIREHRASFPSNQFDAEKSEEINRLLEANRNRSRRQPAGTNIHKLAEEKVKKRWVEQGIWNEKWENLTLWRWKHEEPFERESESEANSAAEGEAPLFRLPSNRTEAKPRLPKSAEELRWVAERQPVREREHEASRPFHQFVYQVSKERERIQDEINPPEPPAPDSSDLNLACYGPVHDQAALHAWAGGRRTQNEPNVETTTTQTPLDINSTAYERVKNTWMKRGIWNRKWGVLPGMSWKHEQPLEETLREELGDDATPIQASPPGDNSCGTGEVPPRSIFGALLSAESNGQAASIRNTSQQEPPADTISGALESHGDGTGGAAPRRNLFMSPSPAESSPGPVTGSLNASPQEPPLAIDPAESLNGDVSHSSTTSNSRHRHAARVEAPRPAPQQRRRFEGRQAPQIARAALGPVHSTKVSKARGKSVSGRGRRLNASELPSEAQQSLLGLDVPALPTTAAPVPPRRSKRLQKAERKTAAGPSGIASPDPHDGGSQSRPRRISASPKPARSAKPQRVSKRRPSTTRRKAR